MVSRGSALLTTVLGNLTAGEDASLLSRDKKTLLSFISFPLSSWARDLAGVAALD